LLHPRLTGKYLPVISSLTVSRSMAISLYSIRKPRHSCDFAVDIGPHAADTDCFS